jgi:hypothetical protein
MSEASPVTPELLARAQVTPIWQRLIAAEAERDAFRERLSQCQAELFDMTADRDELAEVYRLATGSLDPEGPTYPVRLYHFDVIEPMELSAVYDFTIEGMSYYSVADDKGSRYVADLEDIDRVECEGVPDGAVVYITALVEIPGRLPLFAAPDPVDETDETPEAATPGAPEDTEGDGPEILVAVVDVAEPECPSGHISRFSRYGRT